MMQEEATMTTKRDLSRKCFNKAKPTRDISLRSMYRSMFIEFSMAQHEIQRFLSAPKTSVHKRNFRTSKKEPSLD